MRDDGGARAARIAGGLGFGYNGRDPPPAAIARCAPGTQGWCVYDMRIRKGPPMANEFWRDLKPVAEVFRPGAAPEAYIHDAATLDTRWYAPLSPTVGSRPLFISPSQNRWCDVLYCRGAGMVNRHYHPQQVFAYTISGKWGYLEHDWVATKGD